MIRHAPLLALALLLLGGAACSSDHPSSTSALSTELAPCPDHEIDGEVTCYRVTVLENPDRPDGRSIGLEVMVLEARTKAERTTPTKRSGIC